MQIGKIEELWCFKMDVGNSEKSFPFLYKKLKRINAAFIDRVPYVIGNKPRIALVYSNRKCKFKRLGQPVILVHFLNYIKLV